VQPVQLSLLPDQGPALPGAPRVPLPAADAVAAVQLLARLIAKAAAPAAVRTTDTGARND
jgi:hypothetical protein